MTTLLAAIVLTQAAAPVALFDGKKAPAPLNTRCVENKSVEQSCLVTYCIGSMSELKYEEDRP